MNKSWLQKKRLIIQHTKNSVSMGFSREILHPFDEGVDSLKANTSRFQIKCRSWNPKSKWVEDFIKSSEMSIESWRKIRNNRNLTTYPIFLSSLSNIIRICCRWALRLFALQANRLVIWKISTIVQNIILLKQKIQQHKIYLIYTSIKDWKTWFNFFFQKTQNSTTELKKLTLLYFYGCILYFRVLVSRQYFSNRQDKIITQHNCLPFFQDDQLNRLDPRSWQVPKKIWKKVQNNILIFLENWKKNN